MISLKKRIEVGDGNVEEGDSVALKRRESLNLRETELEECFIYAEIVG